ncbi:hypothetical protein AGLY_012459 [Aphis glycines]|uniref:Uncharacterized protein n=1 Tax=Aphis glycines TaxID=307491 RepID=A0A6G0TCC2_APHGL|nr:hypothetical protein AGLY_012459 [Aphis glycines]
MHQGYSLCHQKPPSKFEIKALFQQVMHAVHRYKKKHIIFKCYIMFLSKKIIFLISKRPTILLQKIKTLLLPVDKKLLLNYFISHEGHEYKLDRSCTVHTLIYCFENSILYITRMKSYVHKTQIKIDCFSLKMGFHIMINHRYAVCTSNGRMNLTEIRHYDAKLYSSINQQATCLNTTNISLCSYNSKIFLVKLFLNTTGINLMDTYLRGTFTQKYLSCKFIVIRVSQQDNKQGHGSGGEKNNGTIYDLDGSQDISISTNNTTLHTARYTHDYDKRWENNRDWLQTHQQ